MRQPPGDAFVDNAVNPGENNGKSNIIVEEAS